MIKPCNYDCNQGRSCYCEQPRRLSYRGKVWLAYLATVAVAIGAAAAMSCLLAPGV
jgi:hypothetical protein